MQTEAAVHAAAIEAAGLVAFARMRRLPVVADPGA
jgi:hypothetical protein